MGPSSLGYIRSSSEYARAGGCNRERAPPGTAAPFRSGLCLDKIDAGLDACRRRTDMSPTKSRSRLCTRSSAASRILKKNESTEEQSQTEKGATTTPRPPLSDSVPLYPHAVVLPDLFSGIVEAECTIEQSTWYHTEAAGQEDGASAFLCFLRARVPPGGEWRRTLRSRTG